VAVPEYERLNTGGRITRGNSGNGALLSSEIRAGREHKHGPNEALTVAAMRVNNSDVRPLESIAHSPNLIRLCSDGVFDVSMRAKMISASPGFEPA